MAHAVKLTWVAPANATVTSYNVKRATAAAGPFTTVGTPGTTTFTDTQNLVEGATYFYEVTALNSAGESAPSSEVTATIPFSVPDAPTGLLVASVS